nr:GNAT family N-acetyltransferase [Flexivirga meconopsidis]
MPEQRPLADGYTARALSGDADWEQVIRNGLAENAVTGEYDPVTHERYLRDLVRDRRALVGAGHACFFGAFYGDALVSDLGIVILGDTARYQSVGTDAGHRRRGLAGHLLGRAARWAADRGAREWVVVTESTNDAGRLYRSVGLTEHTLEVCAYRAPSREG